jgi:hypothetical protein
MQTNIKKSSRVIINSQRRTWKKSLRNGLQSSLYQSTRQNLSDPDLIGSPVVTHEEYDAPNSSRRKKKEEVQELNNASEETASDSPGGGGDDEVDKEEDKGEEDKKKQGEVTPPRDPIDEAETSKKRKVSPTKPTSWKKSKASKPQMQTVLMMDDIDFIIVAISDTSEDILQCNEAKQETMYERIEVEMKGVQQALYSSRAVSTVPPSSEGTELGDEPAQLHRIADATKAHLHRVQEEKEQATEALKKAKEESIEKCQVAQQEKDDIQAKFAEDRAQIQKEKEQLLTEKIGVKEAVTRALHSVTGLEQMEEDPVERPSREAC